MSKRTTTPPPEASQREALINGDTLLPAPKLKHPSTLDFVRIKERHGERLLRLSMISQVVRDAGQVGGPWFIRCDGQQLPVSEENAALVLAGLNLSMEEPEA
jgi:hypothetical protein